MMTGRKNIHVLLQDVGFPVVHGRAHTALGAEVPAACMEGMCGVIFWSELVGFVDVVRLQ